MDFSIFTTADAWISLLTLTFLEIVLGVDNIIFISIVTNKLPPESQKKARNWGLLIALGFRVLLLLSISYIIGLTEPVITIANQSFSWKDIILIAGGFFLLAKSTSEIHHKVEGKDQEMKAKAASSFVSTILQIIMIDIVFSFDSILTAVGLTRHILVMIIAVILAMFVMMMFAGRISKIINKYPTLQLLALAFLILIGVTLIMEGFGVHVNKAFVYVAVLFSLTVELLNIRFRTKNG